MPDEKSNSVAAHIMGSVFQVTNWMPGCADNKLSGQRAWSPTAVAFATDCVSDVCQHIRNNCMNHYGKSMEIYADRKLYRNIKVC
jgi:hypothetical protein